MINGSVSRTYIAFIPMLNSVDYNGCIIDIRLYVKCARDAGKRAPKMIAGLSDFHLGGKGKRFRKKPSRASDMAAGMTVCIVGPPGAPKKCRQRVYAKIGPFFCLRECLRQYGHECARFVRASCLWRENMSRRMGKTRRSSARPRGIHFLVCNAGSSVSRI